MSSLTPNLLHNSHMFITLLIATFITAFLVSTIAVIFFRKYINQIMRRIVTDNIAIAWSRYMIFAIYVVGISGGVRIYALSSYINPRYNDKNPLLLNMNRWILEIYRTIIETLQSIAWMLLVFFVVALIAYVIMRIFELKQMKRTDGKT